MRYFVLATFLWLFALSAEAKVYLELVDSRSQDVIYEVQTRRGCVKKVVFHKQFYTYKTDEGLEETDFRLPDVKDTRENPKKHPYINWFRDEASFFGPIIYIWQSL